jgi:hypothetical protein
MLWMASLLATGCSDYGFGTVLDGENGAPILSIEPTELFFDDTHHEGLVEEVLTLGNIGDAAVEIEGLHVRGASVFYVLEDEDFNLMLAPGDGYELPVYFEPGASMDISAFVPPEGDLEHATIEILANDADGPWHQVPLQGSGLYPVLELDPDPYDFGEVLFGCGWEKRFTMSNAGEALLRIESMDHSGRDFVLTEAPEFPMELEPGETDVLAIWFEPTITDELTSVLSFETNEPRSDGLFEHTARGTDRNTHIDTWRQPDGAWEMSDILFFVDQSGSMVNDKTNLVTNFTHFVESMEGMLNDYQIIVVTDDNGCHSGEVITPATTAPMLTFYNAAQVFTPGSLTEAGLSIARNALQNTGGGQCNQGFGREGAKVMLVLISDEPEQSEATWEQLTSEIVALEPTTSISAIAGPKPFGCPTAEPGHGYVEATAATGGLFQSICEPDWGDLLDNLAVLAAAEPHKVFELSARPARKESIVVTVDGAETWDWSFDEEDNAVRFAAEDAPEPLSWIEINYDLGCDE